MGKFIRFDIIKGWLKNLPRKIAYLKITQEIITNLAVFYMYLVFISSRKTFIGQQNIIGTIKAGKPFLLGFWHNRLMMIAFPHKIILQKTKKDFPDFHFMTLSSKHGDGKIVGRIMEKFGFTPILGSTRNPKHKDRGIDLSSMRQIIKELKKGNALGTPFDGPRGPNQEINGNIVELARISDAMIFPISYSTSRFIELKSWDKFKIPLPFSKLCFYCDEAIKIDKDFDEEEMKKVKNLLKEKMDFAQEESLKICQN